MNSKIKQIQVVPYNSAWPAMFEFEAVKIREAFGENCLAVHHVGSTSPLSHINDHNKKAFTCVN